MDKMSPFYTATVASVLYFIIVIMLKYLLPPQHSRAVEWQGALLVAIGFWIVIFLVHQFLLRRKVD